MKNREIKERLKLSKKQQEVLVGILLGDACLETSNNGRTYRLKIEQGEVHREYLYHLYGLFKEWVSSPPREKQVAYRGRRNVSLAFSTIGHVSFCSYACQFYRLGKKQVPELIYHWLTPVGLAYWYMDDGSIKSKESKGVILNTHSFSRLEVNELAQVLGSVFGLQAKERRQREGYQIYISGRSYERFKEIVKPYVIDSMWYKIPPPRRTQLPKE
jgi:uncharacterized protein YktA (UPF0223 family)